MTPSARLGCFVKWPRRICSHVILEFSMIFAAFNQGVEFRGGGGGGTLEILGGDAPMGHWNP